MRRIKFTIPIAQSLARFLLIAITGLPMICRAADGTQSNPSPVAYVYTSSSVRHGGFYASFLNGFAVAADGSAQPLPGSPLNGPSAYLTAAGGHVFASGGPCYQDVATYTVGSNGSLTQSATLNLDAYLPGNNCYQMSIYALNPDREGRFFNIVMSCGSCNSEILPFRIGSDGKLSLSGLILEGGAKWGGEFIFSPDDRYAYTEFPGLAEEKLQENGMLTYVSYLRPPPPPPPGQQQVCLPGDIAASVKGYMAMTWWGDDYWCDQYSNGYELGNYTVNAHGQFGLIGTGLVPAVFEYAMAFDPTGTYLAIVGGEGILPYDPRQAAIQMYKLQDDGTLAAVGEPVIVAGLKTLTSVAWDHSNHLYVTESAYYSGGEGISGLYIFNSNDGVLTPAPGSPHPVNGIYDLAVLPLQ